MENKNIAIIIIVIGLCIGIVWIILSNINKGEEIKGVDFNLSISDTINSLSEDEKQTLKRIKNGEEDYDEMPNAIKDIINPPSLRKGLEDLLYK